ncbi:hypothetical protein D9M72_468400 [compost metagenome]
MIDLVRNERDLFRAAIVGQRFEAGPPRHGAGRVRRACQQYALQRPADLCSGPLQALRRQREAGLGIGLDLDYCQAESGEDVAVGRIAGPRDGDAVARIKQRKEGEIEAGGRSRGDCHPLRIERDTVALPVVAGDRGSQRQSAECVGIAKAPMLECVARSFESRLRRRVGRLPDGHRDHRVAGITAAGRLRQHIHRVKRFDGAAF